MPNMKKFANDLLQPIHVKGDSEEFPRSYIEFTKDRIASKIKKMKAGFRRALDSRRKSGGAKQWLHSTKSAQRYAVAGQQQKALGMEVMQLRLFSRATGKK